jgi:hypothetical protein
MIRIDEGKLRELAKRRGFPNLESIADRAGQLGYKLSLATVYSIASDGNWTRDKLETLCRVLECDPRDFVYFERESLPKGSAPIRAVGRRVRQPA